jgi:hypothetical protein
MWRVDTTKRRKRIIYERKTMELSRYGIERRSKR